MILHLSNFHLEGGAGVAATRLHRALLRHNVHSLMLTSKVQNSETGVIALANNRFKSLQVLGRFMIERFYFFSYEKDSSVRFAFSPAFSGADISEHPLVQRADIIHLHWINFGFLSLNSLEKLFQLGKPIVWTLHDMWAFTGGCHYSRGCDHYLKHCQYCPFLAKPGEHDISFLQFKNKINIYRSAKITFVSPSRWLDDLVNSAQLTKDIDSITIPNCIDTNLFKPRDKNKTRGILNLPKDKTLILFAGANTQDPRKGFNYFQEAINIGSLKNIEVIIFGKSNPDAFSSFPGPVHYMGKVTDSDQMINIYAAADIIVVPSIEDNLPNTIMEAMACGTPAVGFSTGGIPEMIDHKKNGYVSELKSSKSLAEGIVWLIQNNIKAEISIRARQKVLETYSETVVTEQYKSLYQALLR